MLKNLENTGRFWWALFRTNLKAVTALRGSFLLSMTFMALNLSGYRNGVPVRGVNCISTCTRRIRRVKWSG